MTTEIESPLAATEEDFVEQALIEYATRIQNWLAMPNESPTACRIVEDTDFEYILARVNTTRYQKSKILEERTYLLDDKVVAEKLKLLVLKSPDIEENKWIVELWNSGKKIVVVTGFFE